MTVTLQAYTQTHTPLTIHTLLLFFRPLWDMEACYSMIEHPLTVHFPFDQVNGFLLSCVSNLHVCSVLKENLQTAFITLACSKVQGGLRVCVCTWVHLCVHVCACMHFINQSTCTVMYLSSTPSWTTSSCNQYQWPLGVQFTMYMYKHL